MKSRVQIAGHPVHPMVVSFPIAFYTATLISFIIYAVNGNPFWFRLGYVANLSGVVMALVAAVLGYADWKLSIPELHPAKKTGKIHATLNVLALVFFIINAWAQSGKWEDPTPYAGGSIFLSVCGLVFTVAAGIYGWDLVQTHHVGVTDTLEQEERDRIQRAG